MIKQFLLLEWRSFFRSSSVGKSIALKIFLGFLALYFSLSFLALGFGLYKILEEVFPTINPFISIQNYIASWIGFQIIIRFFMQTLPVINMKSFLTQNIKKKTIINYVLIKSLFSFYNLISLLLFIPFTIIAYYEKAISASQAITWFISVFLINIILNYINFLIKKSFTAQLSKFIPFVVMGLILGVLDYFNVFSISEKVANAMLFLSNNPITCIGLLAFLIAIYFLNYTFLSKNFYLDSFLKSKTATAETTDLSWTKRFGSIAPFLQLDLKLIWRNKRPRTTILLSLIFLVYGLIFYTNPVYQKMPAFFVFIGIFTSGMFTINFGQFIPAWDSNYFSLIHAQNIQLKNYLASKAGLMTFSIIVLGLLSIPYVYFGWHILWINLACVVYNIGINVLVILYAGSFNKKKIDLEKSPFMNYQGTGAAQWIVGIPLMLLPLLIWYLFFKLTNMNAATILLASIGIIGIFLRSFFMDKIAKAYKKRKYQTIAGFKQQEN
ncbi:DUF5687 family protein [Flavobacterium sp.]|uniref:DUF5687 family protein n=1 Tax=Flavobacterium sp. TaxID=239 RepID=UPI003F6A116B